MSISEGSALRDQGMELAIDHAEQVDPGWKERAYEKLLQFVNIYSVNMGIKTFMAEDIRSWAYAHGLQRPPSGRAWGGLVRRAALEGVIVQVAIGQVKNKTAHCANAGVWRKA